MVITDEGHRQYELDNGLVVALQNTPTQTVAAKLRVNYGAFHEGENEEGMAHLLEHCLVTGGSQKYSPLVADKIRGIFGDYNAFTSIGRICFEGQMLAEDFEKWLDFVSDHVLKPRFDLNRLNSERGRVLREISDSKSDITYPSSREFNTVFYGDHPKGRFILGKEEVVDNADLAKIKEFHSRGFHPNNIDLIIAGKIPSNIDNLVEKYFGSFAKGKNTRTIFPEMQYLKEQTILNRFAPERHNSDNPEESSAQLVLACTLPSELSSEEYEIMAMSQILGGDTHSLLFQNMGAKKGLAYSVNSSYDGEYNFGGLFVNADVPARRIDEAIETIFEEMDKLKTQKISEKILGRIKKRSKFRLAMASELNRGQTGLLERRLDEGLTPETFLNNYDAVTPEKVFNVANKYLPDKDKGNYVLYISDPLKK